MSSFHDSTSASARASPEEIQPFWVGFPAHIQSQLDEHSPHIANPFLTNTPSDSDTDEPSRSALDLLDNYIDELLRAHRENQEASLLSDTAYPHESNELVESGRELVVDPEDISFTKEELGRASSHLLNFVPGPVPYDTIHETPTPINVGQEAVGRWLDDIVPPPPTPFFPPLPELGFDPNFESFLLSPTTSEAEHSPPTISQELVIEPDNSSTFPSEHETDQPSHASCPEDSASEQYFAEFTHLSP